MCKSEPSQKDESRAQSDDSSKALRQLSAFKWLSECNDVFHKALVRPAKKSLRWKILFHFRNNVPNRYQNQNPYEKTLKGKCCTKVIGNKCKSKCSQCERAHGTE